MMYVIFSYPAKSYCLLFLAHFFFSSARGGFQEQKPTTGSQCFSLISGYAIICDIIMVKTDISPFRIRRLQRIPFDSTKLHSSKKNYLNCSNHRKGNNLSMFCDGILPEKWFGRRGLITNLTYQRKSKKPQAGKCFI